MTIDERVASIKASRQYMMKVALPLGIWFYIEYMLLIQSFFSPAVTILRVPLMATLPLLLYWIVRTMRKRFFDGVRFHTFHGWFFCVNVMFFAGLIDAFGVLIYNKYVSPDNLITIHNAAVAQFRDIQSFLGSSPEMKQGFGPKLLSFFNENAKVLEETPIPTAVEAALKQLSDDIFSGMFWGVPLGLLLRRKIEAPQQPVA
ncbi:MAG: DUF4199 domain-containing protein [Bacteroidales bacterium]|nr:DUF4199 domain-containing protein [Bacteroidales bacterium]